MAVRRGWKHAVESGYTCGAQHVHYVDEMPAVLADLGPTCLHLLVGENTDSGRPTKKAHFQGIDDFTLEEDSLFDVITECRVVYLFLCRGRQLPHHTIAHAIEIWSSHAACSSLSFGTC